MRGDAVHQQVAEVAEALRRRMNDLATGLARAITRDVQLYQAQAPVPFAMIVQGCAANLRTVLEAIARGTDFDPAASAELGSSRAHDGVPLASVMEAYRVGFRALWDAAVAEIECRPHTDNEAMHVLTARVLAAQEIYTDAMAKGYREEQDRRLRGDDDEREILIDSLFHGRLYEQRTLWDAADFLRLPTEGPYVALAAEVAAIGTEAMPGIETKLRSMDVFSAWRLLPDLQIGVVHIKSTAQFDNVLALVSRITTGRVGVSAWFDDLRDTAQAVRFARVTLRGRPDAGKRVRLFDGSILATAAVSAPEVMVKLVEPVIDGFAELSHHEREILFETFHVWLENDGSLRAAGELLFCHPNTVRYRLHRIEQRTGRLLTRPRDVAELSLAFEVHRRLMWQAENQC